MSKAGTRRSDSRGQARPGDLVRVRQEPWIVAAIEPYDACTLYTLQATSPRAPIRTCRVLAPFDDVMREPQGGPPKRVSVRAWRHHCRALLAAHGPAGHLRTAAEASMDLLPYQLEPALALLHGHGCRLLVADEVGLGKTIQAALAAAELLAAGLARRVLILAPSGLREQWAEECSARFGLHLTLLDHASIRRLRAERPPGVNPWSTQPYVVTSIDYVKRPDVLPLALAAPWDVVIVDEAHGVAARSDRHAAAHALCSRSSYVLLLTATPHSGDEDAFNRLCAVGALDGEPRATPLIFRRSRADAGRTTPRRIHTLRVRPSAAERTMHGALADLTRAIRAEHAHGNSREVWLMLSVLHKRAQSGPYALAESAARRLAAMQETVDPSEHQLRLPIDDEANEAADEAPAMWSGPALADRARERRLLERLVRCARGAVVHDSKVARLLRLLHIVREPVIVFTEYRDTLVHLQQRMPFDALVIHGGLRPGERRSAIASFGRGRVLLATDAAGEGLNLQQLARTVVNLELPWNPMRLEQRIGRVDRIGQHRRVHVFNLVSTMAGEARLLDRLARRVARAAARVGAPDPLQIRPAWTEERSAQLLVRGRGRAGDRSDAGDPANDVPTDPGPGDLGPRNTGPGDPGRGEVALATCAAEADAERQRLSLVRAMLPRAGAGLSTGAPPIGTRPLITRTTQRLTRAALTRHSLAVCRSTVTDALGEIVATLVSAALVTIDVAEIASPAALGALRTALQDHLGRTPWLAESRQVQRRLSDTLTRRIHAIARQIIVLGPLHQPGLFDRRAEQVRAEDAQAREEIEADLRDRLLRAEAAARVRCSAPELLLLLTASPIARRGGSAGSGTRTSSRGGVVSTSALSSRPLSNRVTRSRTPSTSKTSDQ
ncbi:MAG: DEAD/DEAH box helicase [Vicinamibacterales bacterium]